MSVDDTTEDSNDGDSLEEYRTTAGVSKREADVVEEHPLKDKFGDDKERKYDAQQAGSRFVDMYDSPDAALRESLSNAETACINRAESELEDAGVAVPNEARKILEKAREVCGYEPQILVEYDRSPNSTALVIEDNGIGITPERYDILRSIGYSENHASGNRLGNFGIGYMSHFLLCGINGSFRLKTHPYADFDPYSTAEYLANFEYLPDCKESIGTRFEFQQLAGAAQNIDIASAVEKYSQGMQVTVMYRDYDETGQETGLSEEYLPTFIEDTYSDDSMVLTYEDEYFKAVMSPEDKNEYVTYNVTMPIKRNCGKSWKTDPKFDAKWKWDFRAKKENGPIVSCESRPELVGAIAIEDTKYQTLPEARKDDHIPISSVPDDAIEMPAPSSSRDSYIDGHNDFWKYVSKKLNDEWANKAAELFDGLDCWSDFTDSDEKARIMRSFNHFIGYYDDPDVQAIQSEIEQTFDTDVSEDVAEKLVAVQQTANLVEEGHSSPNTKDAQSSEYLWKLIDEYGENVYTAKSISVKKAEIVWGLDAGLVKVENTSKYEQYADWFDWTPAKKLPHSNLSEKLPELDDDVAEKWEDKSAESQTTRNSGSRRQSRDPTTKRINIRYGTRSPSKQTQKIVGGVVDNLENDKVFWSRHGISFEHLVVLDATNDYSAYEVANHADRHKGIAATAVPKYVYKYLKDVDNVYTHIEDCIEDYDGVEFSFESRDGSKHTVMSNDLTDNYLVLAVPNKVATDFDAEEICRALDNYDYDDYDYTKITTGHPFENHWEDTVGADVVKLSGHHNFQYNFHDYQSVTVEKSDIRRANLTDDIDTSHEHYDFIFDGVSDDELDEAVEIAEKLGMDK